MMVVYTVEPFCAGERDGVEGVFSSRELAQAFIKAEANLNDEPAEDYEIVQFELDSVKGPQAIS